MNKSQGAVDEDIYAWLKQYDQRFANLPYSPIPKREKRSELAEPIINALLEEFPDLSSSQKQNLHGLVQELWDPDNALASVAKADYAKQSEPNKESARDFLKGLLAKEVVWHNRSDDLIVLLKQHPHLSAYGFAFLKKLLGAMNSLQVIDEKLQVFHPLFDAKLTPAEIGKLREVQASCCDAVSGICSLRTISPHQRARMLLLLRHYTTQSSAEDLEAWPLGKLAEFLSALPDNYPHAVVNDMLVVLHKSFAQGNASLHLTLDHWQALQAIRQKIAQPPRSLEEKKKAEQPIILAPKQRHVLAALLHNISGEVDAKSCNEILSQCVNGTIDSQGLEILATTRWRQEFGETVLKFAELLSTMYGASLNHLNSLCQQLPTFGMSEVMTVLSADGGQLRKREDLVEKLRLFERDPRHKLELDEKGKLPAAKRMDMAFVAEKIAAIRDLTRRPDGEPVPLFPSQQQQLLEMMMLVDNLCNDAKAYLNEAGELVPAMELSHKDIARLMQSYREAFDQPDLTEADKQKLFLRAIPLMRVAMARAADKGEYANEVQLLDVINSMVRHTDDNCDSQLETGQGKTLTSAFKTACNWLQFGEALAVTSDTGLASHNLAYNRNFFKLLGIPVADNIVTQSSKESDWCQGGVNYGTWAGYELMRSNVHLSGNVDALSTDRLGVNIDEKDDVSFDDATRAQHTAPLVHSDVEGESPLAVYYMAMASSFFDSKEFKALDLETARDIEGFEALERFLFHLPKPFEATKAQQEALRGLLQDNRDQLRTWYISLLHVSNMEKGRDYTIVETEEIIDGELRKLKKVCPYTSSGRANSQLDFAEGLQELQQAKQRWETKDPAYVIKSEARVLTSSNSGSFQRRKVGRIVGGSGTVGSSREVSQRLRPASARVNTIPPQQVLKRVDHKPDYCDDRKSHEDAVKRKINACLQIFGNPPILLICTDAKDLHEQAFPWAKTVVGDQKMTVNYLDGEQSKTEEDDILAKAGKASSITVVPIKLGGRGLDIMLDERLRQAQAAGLQVIWMRPPHNKRQEEQGGGRAGRQGQARLIG